jgi:hypothetical protein
MTALIAFTALVCLAALLALLISDVRRLCAGNGNMEIDADLCACENCICREKRHE